MRLSAATPRRIGVFVAGGPAAGINGVTKGIVQEADNHDIEVIGFRDGAEGLIFDRTALLTRAVVEDIHIMGGAILGTSRLDPRSVEEGVPRILNNLRANRIDGLISIGGEGTLQLAHLLLSHGVRIVHVPKTIDNDIEGIDHTFGFDTAVNEAARLLSAIKLDADTSNLWFVVEIMGRYSGHLALEAGIAAGATRVLIPEAGPIDLGALCEIVVARREIDAAWGVILAAESAYFDEDPLITQKPVGGIGAVIAKRLTEELAQREIPAKIRTASMGYFLRCAEPTGFDKSYAAKLGMLSVSCLLDEKGAGMMVSIADDRLVPIPIADVAGKVKRVNLSGVRYLALQECHRYESCRAGLLQRRMGR
jgi:6-phosphofructokinase 1